VKPGKFHFVDHKSHTNGLGLKQLFHCDRLAINFPK